MLYRDHGAEPGDKIAAIDLDGTLVNTKGNRPFALDANDWKLFNKKVPKVLQKYAEEGFKIVIFSNQNSVKSALEGKAAEKVKRRIDNILEAIKVPAAVFCATGQDELRKPEPGMWHFFVKNCNGGIAPDVSQSFFVGDAAGRAGDFADTDKAFAQAIGLAFKTPEEAFGEGDAKKVAPSVEGGPNHNEELVNLFYRLSENEEAAGKMFPARALKKVADTLRTYPKKVESGAEVKHLQGFGKGTIEKINEYLTTGKFAALEDTAEGGGASGSAGQGQASASKASIGLKFL
ncbi:hypothetical protein WJX72_002886 [[Myrmecia] bisecta]|uniref:Crossover junction endonuclease MUS81-like HHH domain-containing protein n=1 Tax=[Myrmecia] bisecta TaxID=41462 RepID=A0AAW1Q6S5_9CHLO